MSGALIEVNNSPIKTLASSDLRSASGNKFHFIEYCTFASRTDKWFLLGRGGGTPPRCRLAYWPRATNRPFSHLTHNPVVNTAQPTGYFPLKARLRVDLTKLHL